MAVAGSIAAPRRQRQRAPSAPAHTGARTRPAPPLVSRFPAPVPAGSRAQAFRSSVSGFHARRTAARQSDPGGPIGGRTGASHMRTVPSLSAAFALLALIAAPASAGKPKAPATPPAGAAAAPSDKPYGDWKKVLKDSDKLSGFLTLHRKRENLYAEIKPSQLEQPFLSIVSFAKGIGAAGLLGGLPLDDRLVQFERSGDHVLLVEVNRRFITPKGSPIDAARSLSISNSVIASLKIESEQDSTHTLLVDLAPVLVSDFTDLGERMRQSFNGKSVRFDNTRSTLGRVKSFPENTEIEAQLTYTPNDRTNFGIESVPDDRYIPVTVHYSFSRLPETPMAIRYADDRVGFFLTAQKDFSRDEKESFFLRYVNHWRLEKRDPSAAMSEPVKPIVYYIDKTVPEKFRPWVKEGVENWQKAFEGAGFKNAILAKDAPDDSTFDPEDVRYSTIRWITSSEPSFGAIGPSRIDPRSGEILDADILFEASMFQNYRNLYRRIAGPQTIAESVMPYTMPTTPGLPPELRCDLGAAVGDAGALENLALLMDGSLPPGSPVPDEYLHPAVVWAVMHEVGHTLGLRHNFRSSTSTPMDKLQDVEWTKEHGLYSSVMEYPTANVCNNGQKQGLWWTTGAGTYDLWAIRYGYTPSGTKDVEADYVFARNIADESLQPGHEYSTDEDTYPADAPDPRSNIFDLGSDPLQFAKDRTTFLAGIWRNPGLEERVVGNSGDLGVLRRAVDTALNQYAIASGMAVKYMGGSYISRVHRGQPGEVDPVTPVAAAKQREALDFLGTRVFASEAFTASPALLQRLMPDRWSHWGMGDIFGSRQDYSWHDRVLALQMAMMRAITNPALLTRMREAESRSADAYRLSEHFDRVTRTLWGEVGGVSPVAMKALEGTGTRRELQRAYVDRLGAFVTGSVPGAPDDARSLARLQLSRIDTRAARVLALATPIGDNTRAHLLETRARIKRVLEASVEADAPAGGMRGSAIATP
jgi:hypothetical protein